MPALPATLATTLEPMVGVLADPVTVPVILPTTVSDHLTYPAMNQASKQNLATATPVTLVTIQASPATLAIFQATQAMNPAMIEATPALPENLAMTLGPMVGVHANLVKLPTSNLATNLNPSTSPATIPSTKHNLATLATPQMSQATNSSTIRTTSALPATFETMLDPVFGVDARSSVWSPCQPSNQTELWVCFQHNDNSTSESFRDTSCETSCQPNRSRTITIDSKECLPPARLSRLPHQWRWSSYLEEIFLFLLNYGMNMDPMAFYQPFLQYPLHLVEHFGLTFLEAVSVKLAIEVLPDTAYFFCAVVEALLATRPSNLSHY
jgi:hypothetical protein